MVARPGAELQRQTSTLSLQPLWGSSSLTDHLLPDRPEAPLTSSQVSAKGFRMQQGQCPTSGCVKGGTERWDSCPSHRHQQILREG